MIERIVSGGQSGADLAGLDVAKALKMQTGGWMPRHFQTEHGPRPEYREKYGLRDLGTASYPSRTRRNIEDSQATLLFSGAKKLEGGTLFTYAVCLDRKKPVFVLYPASAVWSLQRQQEVVDFLAKYRVLNVAGSRASKAPGIYQQTYDILHACLTQMQRKGQK